MKGPLTALLLTAIVLILGFSLGRWMVSPNWQPAMRLAVMGGLVVVTVMNSYDGLLLWMIIAPFGEATWTEIWRILNFRMPPGIPDLTPDRLAVGVLTVLFVAHLGAGRRKLQRLGIEVFMVLFCVMAVPAAFASLAGLNQAGQLLLDKFITPFLVFVLAKNLYEGRRSIDRLGGTLSVIGIYISMMVFYEHVTGQPLFVGIGRTTVYTRSLRKIVSLLGNPAFLGTVLGMIVPVALYLYVRERSPYRRAFYAGVFGMTALGNFFCYNRGAWLALFGALLVLLIERRYRRILLPLVVLAGLAALTYWQAISASAVVAERLSNVSSIRFRLDLLSVSLKLIRDFPLFGVGLGNFSYYFLDYGGHWETLAFDLPSPHNTYILILSTMGLTSFVPYSLILLGLFRKLVRALWRSRREPEVDRALLVSGLAVLTVYMLSAAAVDLYVNVYCSLVLFLITGAILGYVTQLPPPGAKIRTARRSASSASESNELPLPRSVKRGA